MVFSMGALALANSLALRDVIASLVIAGVVSALGNAVIDALGHERGFPRRTPLTHTVPRSILWGSASAIPAIAMALLYYPPAAGAAAIMDGLLVGPSHMLLDLVTEGGIYVKKRGKWRRVALAHIKYDDPLANGAAALAGIAMLAAALML